MTMPKFVEPLFITCVFMAVVAVAAYSFLVDVGDPTTYNVPVNSSFTSNLYAYNQTLTGNNSTIMRTVTNMQNTISNNNVTLNIAGATFTLDTSGGMSALFGAFTKFTVLAYSGPLS